MLDEFFNNVVCLLTFQGEVDFHSLNYVFRSASGRGAGGIEDHGCATLDNPASFSSVHRRCRADQVHIGAELLAAGARALAGASFDTQNCCQSQQGDACPSRSDCPFVQKPDHSPPSCQPSRMATHPTRLATFFDLLPQRCVLSPRSV